MGVEIRVDVGSRIGLEAPGALAVRESVNSPTTTMRNHLMLDMIGQGTLQRVATAVLIDTGGTARHTIPLSWNVAGSTIWAYSMFTALANYTVSTVAYITTAGSTYFAYAISYTINSGWVYALRTTITVGLSASGLTLSPVGSASLGSYTWHNYIAAKLAGTFTSPLVPARVMWIGYEGSYGYATLINVAPSGVVISSTSGGLTHAFTAFNVPISGATFQLTEIRLTLDTGGSTALVVINPPSCMVTINDNGGMSLTVNT